MAIKINGKDLAKRIINGQEVEKVMLNGSQIRPEIVPPSPDDDYLNFTAVEPGSTISLYYNGSPIEISYDKNTRNNYTSESVITLANVGDVVYFRATYTTSSSRTGGEFTMSGKINGGGCVSSLLTYNNYTTVYSIPDGAFYSLFKGCSALKTPPALSDSRIGQHSYEEMFYGTGILRTPKLKGRMTGNYCLENMFAYCSDLESISPLPSGSIPYGGCNFMFYSCSKVKISTTQTGEYQNEYRIPSGGAGANPSYRVYDMFQNTGGTFTGTPSLSTTYYTSNTIIS